MKKPLFIFVLIVLSLVTGCSKDRETKERIQKLEEAVSILGSTVVTLESQLDQHEVKLKKILGEDISWLETSFWQKTTSSNSRSRIFADFLSFGGGKVITFSRSGSRHALGTIRYPVRLDEGVYLISLSDEDSAKGGLIQIVQQDLNNLTISYIQSRSKQPREKATFQLVKTKQ